MNLNFLLPDADELAQRAGERVAGRNCNQPIARAKPHCVALSGGRITQKFFAATVEQAKTRRHGSFRANVHFFWADERCVPPTDPESNFKLANELLFAPLKIPENQIHRLRGEDSPQAAVKIAEAELRHIASTKTRWSAGPGFDFSGHGRGRPCGVAVSKCDAAKL